MRMTVKKETEYIGKGYRIYKNFDYDDNAAIACAEELKKNGKQAFVGEYATNIRGLHQFNVWYK